MLLSGTLKFQINARVGGLSISIPYLFLAEHSLGAVPLLFALCIAHWFTSLNTPTSLHDLSLALRIFYS